MSFLKDMLTRLGQLWYLRGRWRIAGSRLRYDVCTDVPLAVLRLLKEYAADCRSPYFHCVHDDDLDLLLLLIEEGERIERGDLLGVDLSDSETWAAWLHRVADVLPHFWD